ncbi:MAG: YceI family protein [Chloroflexi bacterium]|nr:YceI family protein [Chloroflexota bacterium]
MSWQIDLAHTQVEFAAKYMMFTTVRGRFNILSGSLNINEADPTKSSAAGVIETASVDTRDATRDGHLRSADFFDVEKYPQMTLRTTRIEAIGKGHYKVTADLTIKDVTREVVFDVTSESLGKDPWGNLRQGFSAEATINRKDFGLNWNVALEAGGWLVGDQVKVTIELQAVKQVATEAVAAA